MRNLDEINRLITVTEAELAELESRRSELLARAAMLQREKAVLFQPTGAPGLNDKPAVTHQSSQEEKIALFRSLFRGREDVYPRRFESMKTGKKGYQPVCRNEWVSGICEKPKIRCEDCGHREFLPVTDVVVRNHLQGFDPQDSIRLPVMDEDDDRPWTAPPSRKRHDPPVIGPLPEQIDLVLGNQIYIPKADLTPSLRNRLIRLAAFQNPEFYQAQGMRLSTFGKPRIISCCEDFPKHLGLPRGCMGELIALLESLHI